MGDVRVIFQQDEANEYIFPQVQSETGSNLATDKSVIIEGNRGDGSLYVPGGKKSQRITITGILVDEDYNSLTTKMELMRLKVTTALSTLKLQHKVGASWDNDDWSFSVRRVGEIRFLENLRTSSQEYEIEFLVISY